MALERNVEGLRQNAQKKRQEALDKAEQGIRQLIKEGKPVNFNTLAQAANVSKAFLYKEPEIKERVEQLRQQGATTKPELKRQASDASKDAVIRTLRERIKRLESEVGQLRRQNETAYGQVIEVNSLRQQVGRLQAENDRLTQQSLTNNVCSPLSPHISDFEAEVHSLGVELNTTICKLIRETPHEDMKKSIESLREAIAENRVQNRAGFLNKAIQDTWRPNERYEEKIEQDSFNDWYPAAKQSGLVTAATKIGGVQYVYTSNDEWVTFTYILECYPLDSIRHPNL